MRNKEFAANLKISEETVQGHVKNILAKLSAHDRTEAVTVAVRRGIDGRTPKDKALHLIMDNYSAHNTPEESLAGQASTVSRAFHSHPFFLAEPGGAVPSGT
jgi:hypothetical protein